MFTLLLGYFLGLATTYYFEEIFNNSSDTLNLKSKFNLILKNTIYNHIDTTNKKYHSDTRDVIEDEVGDIKNILHKITVLLKNKDKLWHENLERPSP